MKALEIRQHFAERAAWVDWAGNKTCDQFLHGNPDTEVTGIAVGWMLTREMARAAAAVGINLFITHEPIFYEGYWWRREKPGATERAVAEKKRELDKLGLTVLRCHDTWDRWPGIGIPDAWAAYLGLKNYRRKPRSFYGKATFAPITVQALGRKILRKVDRLGQQHVQVFEPRAKISSICVGTGAITDLAAMLDEVKADCYLVTNDGTNTWSAEAQSIDQSIPLIRVDHATAELPGMIELAGYLGETYPDITVVHFQYWRPYEVLV